MKKKLKLITGFLVILTVIVIGIVFLLADSWNYLFSSENLKEWEKSHFGGIITNNSNHELSIVDNIATIKVPVGKNSRQAGVFDADYLIIKRPTKFQGSIYSSGVIKFCDFSKLSVVSNGKIDEIKPSFSYNFCNLFEEVGWSSRLGYIKL